MATARRGRIPVFTRARRSRMPAAPSLGGPGLADSALSWYRETHGDGRIAGRFLRDILPAGEKGDPGRELPCGLWDSNAPRREDPFLFRRRWATVLL